MNCGNHPAAEVAAYCQQCGKPLCAECMHSVNGMIYCEPCLAARLGARAAGQTAASANYPATLSAAQPSPFLAGVLGIIPGVGAMYNGQLVKGLVHVLIFAILVGLANHDGIFGILIFAWILYQVFDAYYTARARLDGLPLPNPFGLNDLGTREGLAQGPPPHSASYYAPPPSQGAAATLAPPVAPVQDREPVGAIVLIVVGLFLLLQTLGILHGEWIHRSWPLLIVGFGVWWPLPQNAGNPERRSPMKRWLLIRRVQGPAFLILFGITLFLQQWGILSLRRSWPLYLILAGALQLAERAAMAADPAPPYFPLRAEALPNAFRDREEQQGEKEQA